MEGCGVPQRRLDHPARARRWLGGSQASEAFFGWEVDSE
jgi:hypothetical protein